MYRKGGIDHPLHGTQKLNSLLDVFKSSLWILVGIFSSVTMELNFLMQEAAGDSTLQKGIVPEPCN